MTRANLKVIETRRRGDCRLPVSFAGDNSQSIDQSDLSTFSSQLRYLQTLNSISAENNSTIIFPVPIDIISQLMGPSPVSGDDGGHGGHHDGDIVLQLLLLVAILN